MDNEPGESSEILEIRAADASRREPTTYQVCWAVREGWTISIWCGCDGLAECGDSNQGSHRSQARCLQTSNLRIATLTAGLTSGKMPGQKALQERDVANPEKEPVRAALPIIANFGQSPLR